MQLKELYKIGLNRDIVMFGLGRDGETFYRKFQKDICTHVCYDNGKKESFHDIPVKKPARKQAAGNSKELIVICSSSYKREMEEQLLQLGYEPWIDFVTDTGFEYFTEADPEKKIALFYGSCHSNSIMNGMSIVPDFYHQYNHIHIRIAPNSLLENELLERLLPKCDLVVYDRYVGNQIDTMDIKAVKIGFPQIMFYAYFPQNNLKRENEFFISSERYDDIMLRRDDVINDMVYQGKSEDEILSYITSDDVISREEVERRLKRNLATVKAAEKISTIKISDFFLEHYRKFRIYLDWGHMSDLLIREYVRRMLTYMGIENVRFDNERECFPHTETPIYPSVAKYLELEMIDSNTKYRVIRDDGTEYLLSFEEYEREYIRSCQKILGT